MSKTTAKMIGIVLGCFLFFQFPAKASETIKGAQKDYEKFKAEMTSNLESVEMKISELRQKVKKDKNVVQEEVLNDLEKTRLQLKSDLDNMKESGKSNWKKVKSSFAESFDRLNKKVQKAVSKD